MKQFYIYIVENLINHKKYIGQHYGELTDSYMGSGTTILKALEKYGKENFSKQILTICESREEADKKEKEYIQKYNCVEDKKYYNLQEGGTGGDGWRAAKRYFENHPEKAKQLYEASGKRLRKWAKKNPELVQLNIEKMHEGSQKWKKEHPKEVEAIMKKVNQAKEKWQQEHYEEWQTQIKDFIAKGAETNSQKVLCVTTGKIFPSLSEAARYYNTAQSNISKCLKGERKSSGKDPETGEKLIWKRITD